MALGQVRLFKGRDWNLTPIFANVGKSLRLWAIPMFRPLNHPGQAHIGEKGEIEGGGDNGEGANGADESQHVDAFPTIADDDGRGNVVEQPRWRRRL